MIGSLANYIEKEKLFYSADKILLTVSGGIDSMLMCELFHKAGFKFGIAHCNFQLRGAESDSDEAFVRTLAENYNVPFHFSAFDTAIYSKANKLSIQTAARQLRYKWFEEIREQYNYNYIATAHHKDDSIETFLINLVRGTGISGLHGILPKHGNIIRPMLFTSKNEIETYVKKHKLEYRSDSSNKSDKYVRNKIRLRIIPVLKELNPGLENTISNNIQHLRDVELIYKNDIEAKRSKIVKPDKNSISISIKQLNNLKPVTTYLYEFLKPYNFNSSTVEEIITALEGESGRLFFSETHRLIKDRKLLIIEPRIKSQETKITTLESKNKTKVSEILISKNQKEIKINRFKLIFKPEIYTADSEIPISPLSAVLDFDKLAFPLEIRKWQKGDVFYPLGMKGKKKLSDFFIDKKLSINQKENTWLLTSAGNIAWVIGHRIDDRFKITNKTLKIYFVELV